MATVDELNKVISPGDLDLLKEVVETGVDLNTVDDSDPARKSAEHLCTLDYDAVGLWGTVGCYRDAWVQEWDC